MKTPAFIQNLKDKIIAKWGEDKSLEKQYFLLTSLVIIVLLNLVGSRLYCRADLTRNNTYSLSQVSRDVVSGLKSPLTIRAFFTRDLPAPYNSVPRYLTDLLEEYTQYNPRYFHYRIIHPDNEKTKREAADYGVYPIEIREYKSDQMKASEAYMGLVIEHEDLVEKIDSLTSFEGIEYRITSLIRKMDGKVGALAKINTPIVVTLYATSNIPNAWQVIDKVKERFNKSNQKNNRKLNFKHVDPLNEKSAFQRAESYGIPKILMKAGSGSGRTEEGIIGITVEYGEKFETIQLLARTLFGLDIDRAGIEKLDDRINSAVTNLISVNPMIGYITGHGELNPDDPREGAGNFKPLIPDMYSFQTIDLKQEAIPDGINAVIINGPKMKFTDAELFKLDQYLMKGKSLILFLDAFNEIRPQGGQQMQMFGREPVFLPIDTGLEALLAHYGISVNKDMVLDMKCFSQRGDQPIYVAPVIDDTGLNRENEITRYLKKVLFFKSCSLGVDDARIKAQDLRKTDLVRSSSDSWLMKGRISLMPWAMKPPHDSQMARQVLSLMVSGKMESFFKDKPIPALDEKPAKGKTAAPVQKFTQADIIKRAIKNSRILVTGTSEITRIDFDREGKPNSVLLHNMIDYMNGNYEIPEMRSKGLELNPIRDDNPLARFIRRLFSLSLHDAAEWARVMFKVINILLFPAAAIAGATAWIMIRRRRRRTAIQNLFAKKEA